MSWDKYESTMRSVRNHQNGIRGATCPHAETLNRHYDNLGYRLQYRARLTGFREAVAYALKVHEALTQDPNKDTAQMSTAQTVTHKFAKQYPHSQYSHMTGGRVKVQDTRRLVAHVVWPNGKEGQYPMANLTYDEPQSAPEAAHAFTPHQYTILAALFTGQKRTDVLATALGTTNAAVASNEALPLREKGLLTTTNDGQPYVLWTLTAHGLFVAGEIERRKREQKTEQERLAKEHAAGKAKNTEWILWSPESNLPPKVRYSCEQEAMAVGESMAKRYPGQSFIACELHAGFKVVKVKKERVVVDTVDKLEQF